MSAPTPDPILLVLKGLIRPLVRMLIARGVTAPAFYRLLKAVYVDVAEKDFRIDEAPPTDSRITLLTGVHRRDVRAILTDSDDAWETQRVKTSTFATVLGQWLARPDYLDATGAPMVLPRAGEAPSFDALVASISRDIRPRTVLDELMRLGLVEEPEDGRLAVSEGALVGPSSPDDKIVFFAANVGDHLAAATDNIMSDAPPFLERAVFYNRLKPGSVDAIEAEARAVSQDVLERLNKTSSAHQAADKGADDATERYRFGVYFYREQTETPKDARGGDEDSD